MSVRERFGCLGLAVGALVGGLACSSNSPSSSQPDAGSSGRGISGAGGAAMLPFPNAGAGGSALLADASIAADSGAVADSGSQVVAPREPLSLPDGCPTIRAIPVSGQQWAIVAVRFKPPEVIFQNVSPTEQTLTTDHQWCWPTAYERVLPFDRSDPSNLQLRVFQPGEIVRVPLTQTDARVTLIDKDSSGGEMALYPATSTYPDPDKIMAYVSWGSGQPFTDISRADVAARAGLYTVGDHVPIAPGHVGFVAIGNSNVSEGYVSVPARCYPQ